MASIAATLLYAIPPEAMSAALIQAVLSGLTVGAVYALVALGMTIIYAASDVVNFAQGEFVMLGGMATWFLAAKAGVPLPLAAVLAILITTAIGLLVQRFGLEPARDASVLRLIIITIGASMLLRGVVHVMFGTEVHTFQPFSGATPIKVAGASLQTQSLWVMGGAGVIFLAIWLFFSRTLVGKALLAASANRSAAELVGIDPRRVMGLSFALAAAIGAIAGVLVTPITLTAYDVGGPLALKGFAAAMLGGMGNPLGAVIGGLLIGILEQIGAGLLAPGYQDAIAYGIILLVLFALPNGLFGHTRTERV